MDRNDLSSFGTVLKAFRTRRCLTQQQLAQRLGVRRNTIGTWERGDFLPGSKGIVLELARHLHLDDQQTRQLLEASLTALSPYWHVPLPRNPYFTGREEILVALHTQLGVNQAVALTQSCALHGLGGVGKTQIALEYAYRHALEYSAVFWIGAETSETIISGLLRIADVLQLPGRDDKDQQRVIAAVHRWLTTHSQWLLIWDNVEDLALLDHFLPSIRQGAVLLTTRHQTLGTLARGIDLLPMEQQEGVLLLLRRAKVLEAEAGSQQMRQLAERMPAQYAAAAELVTAMGGLPLALDQAGAYLEETQCGLPAYLDHFRTRRAALLQQRGEGSRDHLASVSATFTLAITATAGRHPAVSDLLRVCALLQPDAIPEALFRQGGEHLGAQLQAACRDILEWDRMVAVACAYSLLSRQPEEQTLSIHQLVQAVLLDAMTEPEREQWTRLAIGALDAVFPEVPDTEYADWKQRERLLPHALLCLQRTATAEESLALASLAYKTARYLHVRGRYAQAELLYQRALHIREHLLGPDHCDVATSLYHLAEVSREQGKYAQVEPLFQRALQIREQSLGPDHPDVATSLTGLALLYWVQGKYALGEALFQRASRVWEQTLGSDHPRVATSLYHLAEVSQEQGKYVQAEPLFQRALRVWEQALGPDHPHLAFSLNGLARLYWKQGKDAQAEPLFQRASRIWEQALGSDHPYVAYSLTGLARLYSKQGQDAQAEALFQRALQIREQSLGPDHPDMAYSLDGLAELYAQQGEDEQAEPLYQRALCIWEQALGPEHPDVAYSLNGLAGLYAKQGKDAQAQALFQRALSIREQHLGKLHPETAQTLSDLAVFRQKQGHLSEAIALVERALSIHSQSLGEAHPKTVVTRTLSIQLVQAQGRLEKEKHIHAMSIAVRGATEQVAYTRNVRMREVTFTCAICGQTVTQLHYPSGRLKYCSEVCRAVRAAQMQEERVARQREKRRADREAHLAAAFADVL